jgi:hypothetical protein
LRSRHHASLYAMRFSREPKEGWKDSATWSTAKLVKRLRLRPYTIRLNRYSAISARMMIMRIVMMDMGVPSLPYCVAGPLRAKRPCSLHRITRTNQLLKPPLFGLNPRSLVVPRVEPVRENLFDGCHNRSRGHRRR